MQDDAPLPKAPARGKPPREKGSADPRTDRLKAALKANMARRKAQAKARAAGPATDDSEENHKQDEA